MLTPGQSVTVKPNTPSNPRILEQDELIPLAATVVRVMAGNQYVILDLGSQYQIRARMQDIEVNG